MTNNNLFLSIVVPCYNEEESINFFMVEIMKILETVGKSYEIIFINDGSGDKTLEKLLEEKEKNKNIKIINFSRNFGKEAALTAGIDKSSGEVVVPMDIDLQDPPELILEFIDKYNEGYDVVVAKRIDRSSDSFLKRVSAELFYRIHNKISSTKIPYNVGDFRLISRRVADEIKNLRESQRFMKGIFSWVGFKTATIEYKREKRVAGNSSFNGWKLWNFAIEGITSFSTAPLRIWLYIGIFVAFFSFLYGIWIVLKTLLFGVDVPGYASMLTVILFLGGVQLIGIGVIGEYVGRIYIEVKNRPMYIIESEY